MNLSSGIEDFLKKQCDRGSDGPQRSCDSLVVILIRIGSIPERFKLPSIVIDKSYIIWYLQYYE